MTGCNRRTDDTDRPLDARDDEEISYYRFDRFDRFLTVFDRFVAVLCATDLSEEELIAPTGVFSRLSRSDKGLDPQQRRPTSDRPNRPTSDRPTDRPPDPNLGYMSQIRVKPLPY